MRTEEIYFLAIGCGISLIIGYLVAQHSKTEGFSFGKSLFYSCIGLCGLVFMAWQYLYGR